MDSNASATSIPLPNRGLLAIPLGSLLLLFTILLALALVFGGLGCPRGASATGVTPTAYAKRDIPPTYLQLYIEIGARYQLPWPLLAAIGKGESDHGRNPAAFHVNYAGCTGPMQVGVSGACGCFVCDYGQDGNNDGKIDPNNPADAIATAANGLRKGKGAPPMEHGTPAAYYQALCNYAGTCLPYAPDRIATARTYGGPDWWQPGGTFAAAGACAAAADGPLGIPTVPGAKAVILKDGTAAAPQAAPLKVQQMVAAGDRIIHFPYSFGGAHGAPAQTMDQRHPNPAAAPGQQENGGPGYDCSSATDYVLWGGGFGTTMLGGGVPASGELEGLGQPGPGQWVTVYANPGHAYIEVAGIYLDTAAGLGREPNPPSTGPRWTPHGTGPAGFVPRHPPGL